MAYNKKHTSMRPLSAAQMPVFLCDIFPAAVRSSSSAEAVSFFLFCFVFVRYSALWFQSTAEGWESLTKYHCGFAVTRNFTRNPGNLKAKVVSFFNNQTTILGRFRSLGRFSGRKYVLELEVCTHFYSKNIWYYEQFSCLELLADILITYKNM